MTARQRHSIERAAESTVDALMYSLRCGRDALSNFNTLSRTSELNEQQLIDVATRLQRFKPHVASAWAPDEIEVLVAVWRKLR